MAVTVYGVLPGTAKPQPVFPAHSLISFGLQKPRVAALPLRPLVTFGPRPDSIEAAPLPAGSKVAPAAPEAAAPEAGREPSVTAAAPTVAGPTAPAPASESKPAKGRAAIRAEIRTAQVRARTKLKGAEALQGRGAESPAEASANPAEGPAEHETAAPAVEPVAPAAASPAIAEPVPSAESPVSEKTTEKAADRKAEEKPKSPAVAEKAPPPPTVSKPDPAPVKTIAPKRTFDFEPAANSSSESPAETLPEGPKLGVVAGESFLSRMPALVKIAAGIVIVAGIGMGVYFTTAGASSAKPVASKFVEALVPGPLVGDTGWSNDWGGDAASRRSRQISLYRASQNVADYRFEIQAQIESKAIGWVFRAKNPQNYHAAKLEVLKGGLNPTVALVRFSVVNGEETARTQLPLPMPVRVDTLYKVRTEARGDKFGIWVNDQLIQEWADDRIRVGGVGMYTERGERASVRNVAVTQMVPRK
jgi:hypothetical protein